MPLIIVLICDLLIKMFTIALVSGDFCTGTGTGGNYAWWACQDWAFFRILGADFIFIIGFTIIGQFFIPRYGKRLGLILAICYVVVSTVWLWNVSPPSYVLSTF